MRNVLRLSPVLMALALVLFFAAGAEAQMDCSQCTPYSGCDDACMRCQGALHPEGYCDSYEYTTCGDIGGFVYGCMPSSCTPSWTEVSRELRGTYGNGSMFSCSHHRVEWVTKHDNNQCNTNSTYWNASSCEDTVDGGKSGWFPDCCNGYGPDGQLDSTYTCNHYHSC